MNNKEFIAALANKTGYTREETQKLMTTIVTEMGHNFEKGEGLYLPSFGMFEVKKRLERVMVNPSTGLRMLVPPKLVLNFRPVSAIKNLLKNGGDDNE